MSAHDPKVLVLHSGGMDSTVCLPLAREQRRQPISLGVDYGQHHLIELEYARQQCSRLGIPRREVRVSWTKGAHEIPLERTVHEIKSGRSTAFLPGRNQLFLALAFAEAAGVGATEVWIGVNAVDYSGYPDCTADFINAFQVTADKGLGSHIPLVTPLMTLGKPAIAELSARLGLTATDTWSCYRPAIASTGITPCGKCDACVLHAHAWSSLKQV